MEGRETVKMDDKGRVLGDRKDLVERVKTLKLVGDKERAHMDAATVKDLYGGLKH